MFSERGVSMQTILVGIFFLLHGMVHLLYAGQSWRFFELRPEMTWPDGAWLFSKSLGDETTRLLATALLVLAALGFFKLAVFRNVGWKIPCTCRSGWCRNPDQPCNSGTYPGPQVACLKEKLSWST
jgi:hypothetical protein